jgi:hypothetical protein
MSVLRWLKPAMLAATVVTAGSLSAAAAAQAQDVTVLRGSPARPSQPYSSIDCNNPYYAQYCQDNQSIDYSPLGYDDNYPDYWGDFPFGFGDGRGFHRGFRAGFHRGGFHRGGFNRAGFHRGGFHPGGFHPGGFSGGGFHGGGGHR